MNEESTVMKYYDWLFDMVEDIKHPLENYEMLLMDLNEREFTWTIFFDKNRADDGLSLRYRHALFTGNDSRPYLTGKQASMLEVIIALAIRSEEMLLQGTNQKEGVSMWFWLMIKNLGLESMTNDIYDKRKVDKIINRFLNREYSSNGKGGLFTLKKPKQDMREIEIWYQMHAYFNEIFNN